MDIFEYAETTLKNIIENENCSVDFDFYMRRIDEIHVQLLFASFFGFTETERSILNQLVKEARYCLLDSIVVRCLIGFSSEEQQRAALSTINFMYGTNYRHDIPGDGFSEKFKNIQSKRKEVCYEQL